MSGIVIENPDLIIVGLNIINVGPGLDCLLSVLSVFSSFINKASLTAE